MSESPRRAQVRLLEPYLGDPAGTIVEALIFSTPKRIVYTATSDGIGWFYRRPHQVEEISDGKKETAGQGTLPGVGPAQL